MPFPPCLQYISLFQKYGAKYNSTNIILRSLPHSLTLTAVSPTYLDRFSCLASIDV